MGWYDRLKDWLKRNPAKSTVPEYRRTAREDEEDEEIAELLAIDII